ncbi:aminoacyl carrier protein [Alsobacter metallidurans]|uniref:Aminoacyl carrier protein n=1 Tax=Alsobacter metallidurans TaxID=340221 RepID=A0A917MGG2_9HYPH|nr:aminoacyl carrier protein [Alsobacter metallidurans]
MSEAIRNTIVAIIVEAGRLPVAAETLTDDADLYQAGLTSFASVQLMLAIEDRFGVEFPDRYLNRRSFASIASIRAVVSELLTEREAA